jgi:hypothetical protein
MRARLSMLEWFDDTALLSKCVADRLSKPLMSRCCTAHVRL